MYRVSKLIAIAMVSIVALPIASGLLSPGTIRTPWVMHDGIAGKQVLPIPKGCNPKKHGDNCLYDSAVVPNPKDSNWKDAPDGNIINMKEKSRICKVQKSCYGPEPVKNYTESLDVKYVDYTYFQSSVTIPKGKELESFHVVFRDMDDGTRVSIYNSKYPDGVMVADSYVYLGNDPAEEVKTGNLQKFVVLGEPNRVVLTQVDDCCDANNLGSAKIFMKIKDQSGEFIPVRAPPKEPVKAPPKEPVKAPPKKPVKAPPKEPVKAPPKKPVKAPPKEPVKAPPKEPIKAPPKKPVKAPPKEPVKAPPKEPIKAQPKKPVKAPPKEPVKAPPKEPVKAPPKEPVKAPPKEPVKAPPKEPVKAQPKKPVKVPPKEPVKAPPKEPVKAPPKEPVKAPPKEPVKQPPKEPVKVPPKEPVKAPPKEPVKAPPKEPVKAPLPSFELPEMNWTLPSFELPENHCELWATDSLKKICQMKQDIWHT